jgi:RHS repeat-associated protein
LTLQGAGGVGGLLSVVETDADLSTNAYYATADANGNITDYVTETGTVAARFAYDAFGRVISESIAQGLEPKAFTHRFSSKYQDVETGLNYYGFRYYDPEMGRWLNRDPIGERGGLNLYGFVGNKSIIKYDILGLEECPCTPEEQMADALQYMSCVRSATAAYETCINAANQATDMWLDGIADEYPGLRAEVDGTWDGIATYSIESDGGFKGDFGEIMADIAGGFQMNALQASKALNKLAANITKLALQAHCGIILNNSLNACESKKKCQ